MEFFRVLPTLPGTPVMSLTLCVAIAAAVANSLGPMPRPPIPAQRLRSPPSPQLVAASPAVVGAKLLTASAIGVGIVTSFMAPATALASKLFDER